MSGEKGQRPTHRLCVLDKETSKKGTIGVAWQKPDGSISIQFEAGVSISWKDDFVISLFPIVYGPMKKKADAASEGEDEDLPF